MSYFVVMIDYGRAGLEAMVHPEDTRRNVIDYINEKLGDGLGIAFVDFIEGRERIDVTEELLCEAQNIRAARSEGQRLEAVGE